MNQIQAGCTGECCQEVFDKSIMCGCGVKASAVEQHLEEEILIKYTNEQFPPSPTSKLWLLSAFYGNMQGMPAPARPSILPHL